MAYKVIILYQLYMPSYFLGTFTEYPRKAHLEGIFFFLLIDIVLKLLLCYQKSFFSFARESGK